MAAQESFGEHDADQNVDRGRNFGARAGWLHRGQRRRARRTARTAQAANTDWAGFRDGYIEGWFKQDPANAVYQGRHDFDGGLGDWSAAGLQAQAKFLTDAIAKAKTFTDLKGSDAFERDYLIAAANRELFWLTDADQPHTNPAWYVGHGLDPNVYIARNYADKPTRMKALIKFFGAVPQAAANIRANLKTPMPLSFVNYGVAGFKGFGDYYRGDARKAFADVADQDLQKQFADASEKAGAAMADLATWLEAQKASATQDFALGPDRFQRMVAMTEGVDASLDQLEAAGRADLKRNQDALKAACAQYAPGATIPACMDKMNSHKGEGGPVAEARRQIPMLRKFVVDHNIVTIPDQEQALVEESPPYNRQNSAYIDPPGPFEKGIPSIYYISPPDPAWDKATQDAFVKGKNELLFTSRPRGDAGPFPAIPPCQCVAVALRAAFRRLCVRGGLGALFGGDDVGSGLGRGRSGGAHRPAVERVAARLPVSVGDRHAWARHDAGAVA